MLRSRKAAKAHKNLLHIDAVEKHMRAVDVKHKPEGLSPVCACACAFACCLALARAAVTRCRCALHLTHMHICNAPRSEEAPLVPKMCVDG